MSMATVSFKNNQVFLKKKKIRYIKEFPLYTDASYITGQIDSGDKFPYEVLNPIVDFKQPLVLPRIILRVFLCSDIEDDINYAKNAFKNKKFKSNFEGFTSLGIQEEISALLSLIFGILRAGNANRTFTPNDHGKIDNYGSIVNQGVHKNPPAIRVFNSFPRIPNTIRCFIKKTRCFTK